MNINVNFFTKGKSESKNEDSFKYRDNSFVLSDGASDKSGVTFDGKTGGEILSHFLAEKTLNTNLNGLELVEYLTKEIQNLYHEINVEALSERNQRFGATLVCFRIENGRAIFTLVGDSVLRINGSDIYTHPMLIDEINTELRQSYIQKTGDIDGAYDFIFPMLRGQIAYQNDSESPLGYGSLDGTNIPEKFIKTFELPISELHTVELVSDGYMKLPEEVSIDAYEKIFREIDEIDPYKYKEYPALKFKDDRTVAIVSINQ